MSTLPPSEECTAPDEQLRRELELLIQRHAEFSRRLEAILAELERNPTPASTSPQPAVTATSGRELRLLNDRLSHAEEHLDALAQQVELNAGRVQDILESRTWKLFTGMGGVLLKLAGRR